jgi:hypothetical protein
VFLFLSLIIQRPWRGSSRKIGDQSYVIKFVNSDKKILHYSGVPLLMTLNETIDPIDFFDCPVHMGSKKNQFTPLQGWGK